MNLQCGELKIGHKFNFNSPHCISIIEFRETYFTDELFACHGANCKDNGGRGAGGGNIAPVEPEENYDYDVPCIDENEGCSLP